MKNSLVKSTSIVALSTLFSRITGFIRDMIIADCFGASGKLDGFFIAFRIPNLLRRLVAEGALTISFIPIYTEYLTKRDHKEALELAQKTLSILILILIVFTVIGEIFSPAIVKLFAYGFTDSARIGLTVFLNRILFPYIFLVGLVAFSMGVLNSHGRFFSPAFAPVLLNVGFIIGAIYFSRFFNEPLYGLAIGVLFGGLLQVLLQIPYLINTGFRIKFSVDLKHPGIRRIFRMITPALFGIAVYQINILMSTILASMLAPGSISYLYYSDRLTEIVLGVFIFSISNVILPEMSNFSANNDLERLKSLYIIAVKASLFLAIPASIAMMTVGTPIISTLFMRGEFTPLHVSLTYKALLYASIGVTSISILRITTPAFYSLKDTKTPVITSAIAFILNIVLGYLLMQTSLKHAGLSLANSISVTVQTIILVGWLQRRIGILSIESLILPVIKYIASGLVMAYIIWNISGFVDWFNDPFAKRLLFLLLIVIVGGTTYLLICIVAGVKEISLVRDKLYKISKATFSKRRE
ncbi:MAG: murein biosynthesis integral membrane protein MurJ [Spirochaetota bacterium]|nr:murein biosynthesis integral membrane protein MurJ [Spirochaetota bacterium]